MGAVPAVPDVEVPDGLPLEDLERLAVEVAQEAARLIVEDRPDGLGVARTKSSATDVVTVMDQRAQDLLRQRLRAARPGDGFLGEEEGGDRGTSGVTWVVDPIDGTVNYLYGIPAYAVSVAAVVGDPATPGRWRPVAGAVVDPERGRTFHARLGGGAWRRSAAEEPERLQVGDQAELSQALVGSGFGYEASVRVWQAKVLLEVISQVRDIRRIGSAALDLCHVADGELDAYFERGLNAWDMAAAWLVVTEAGGAFGGLAGEPADSGMVIAGPPGLFARLEEVVAGAVRRVGPSGSPPSNV
jgi:myo-inositol-1(or 4)-monophosphatase